MALWTKPEKHGMLFLSEVQEGMQHADLVFPVCVSHGRSGERGSLSALSALVQTRMRKAEPGISSGPVRASGLLLPLVFPGLRRFPKMALVVLATTVSIETFQFFIGRSADIDDVIMNLAGGLLGYAVFALLNRFLAPSPRWQRTLGIEE